MEIKKLCLAPAQRRSPASLNLIVEQQEETAT